MWNPNIGHFKIKMRVNISILHIVEPSFWISIAYVPSYWVKGLSCIHLNYFWGQNHFTSQGLTLAYFTSLAFEYEYSWISSMSFSTKKCYCYTFHPKWKKSLHDLNKNQK